MLWFKLNHFLFCCEFVSDHGYESELNENNFILTSVEPITHKTFKFQFPKHFFFIICCTLALVNSNFCSMKQIGVFLFPKLGGMLAHQKVISSTYCTL